MTFEDVSRRLEEAWSALSSANPERASSLANQALRDLSAHTPAVVEALMTIAVAELVRRNPLRARFQIRHAMKMPFGPEVAELRFLSIEVADAMAEDPALSAGESPTADLAAETLNRLREPARTELRRAWFRFILRFTRLMLVNGRNERAAAAARRVFRVVPLESVWPEEGFRAEAASLVVLWAEAELKLARDGQRAELTCLDNTLHDVLGRAPPVPEGPRFDLLLLRSEIAFRQRRSPSEIAAVLTDAKPLASTGARRTAVLACLGALAVRHPAQLQPFLEGMRASCCDELREGRPTDLLLIARAALALGDVAGAERVLSIADAALTTLDALERLDRDALCAEILLRRHAAEAAVALASDGFEAAAALVEGEGRDPSLGRIVGSLTYARVCGQLEQSLKAASEEARSRAVALALSALDQGRALRIASAFDRDDARSDHGPMGLASVPERVSLDGMSALAKGAVAVVFLWDNRETRLGVFIVEDPSRPRFHWLRLPSGPARMVHAAELASDLNLRSITSEDRRALRELVDTTTEVVWASFEDDLSTSLGSFLEARRPSHIHVVPHGPLVGLPLHVSLLRTAPREKVNPPTVSFAPTLLPLRMPRAGEAAPARAHEVAMCASVDMEVYASAFAKMLAGLGREVHCLARDGLRRDLAHMNADVLVILAHGAAPLVPGAARASAGSGATTFGSEIRLGESTVTTHDILRARHVRCGAAFLCLCSGARHIDPVLTDDSGARLWQIEFLDDATMGLAGALLSAGVPDVVAFPIAVDAQDAPGFLGKILKEHAGELGKRGAGFDWAQAIAWAQEDLGVRRTDGELSLLMAQHWRWAGAAGRD